MGSYPNRPLREGESDGITDPSIRRRTPRNHPMSPTPCTEIHVSPSLGRVTSICLHESTIVPRQNEAVLLVRPLESSAHSIYYLRCCAARSASGRSGWNDHATDRNAQPLQRPHQCRNPMKHRGNLNEEYSCNVLQRCSLRRWHSRNPTRTRCRNGRQAPATTMTKSGGPANRRDQPDTKSPEISGPPSSPPE